jgi:lipopolysaccharide biosynthesis glycosyltransferase/uncharacterized protein (DUF3084 family)
MIGFKRFIGFKDSEQTEITSEIHCLIREKDEAFFEANRYKEKIKALEERIRKIQLSKDSKYQKDTALLRRHRERLMEQLETVRQQRDNIRNQVIVIRGQRDKVKERLETVRQQRDNIRNQVIVIRGQRDKVKERLEFARQQRDNIRNQVIVIRGQRDKVKERLEFARQQRDNIRNQVIVIRGQRDKVKERLETVRQQRDNIRNQVIVIRGQRDKVKERLEFARQQRDNIRNQVIVIRGQRDKVKERLETVRQQRDNIRNQVIVIRGQRDKVKERLEFARQQRDNIRNQVIVIRGQRDKVKERLEFARQQRDNIRNQVIVIRGQRDKVKERLETVRQQRDNIRNQVIVIRGQRDKVKERLEFARQQRDNIRNQVIVIRGQRDKVKERLETVRQQRDNIRNQVIVIRGQRDKVKERLEFARQQRDNIRNQVIVIRGQRDKVKERLEFARQQRDNIRNQVIVIRGQRDKVKERLEFARQQRDNIRNQVIVIRGQRDKVKERLEFARQQRDNIRNQVIVIRGQRDKVKERLEFARQQRDNIRNQVIVIRGQRDKVKERLETVRQQRDNIRNQVIVIRGQRDKLKERLETVRQQRDNIRNQASVIKRRQENIQAEYLETINIVANAMEMSLKENDLYVLASTLAHHATKKSSHSQIRESLRNACSHLLNSSSSGLLRDKAHILLSIINFNNGLGFGAYTYLKDALSEDLKITYALHSYLSTTLQFDQGDPEKHLGDAERILFNLNIPFDSNTVTCILKSVTSAKNIPPLRKRELCSHYLKKLTFEALDASRQLTWANEFCHSRIQRLQASTQIYDNLDVQGEIINIGIMDYKVIDINFCSGNLGDYVQSIASALAWSQATGLSFDTSTTLGCTLNRVLNANTDTINHSKGNIILRPIIVDRDSAYWSDHYPEKTWFVCNGWYHHSSYNVDVEFGFPSQIVPIFVSFHLNKSAQVRPELVNYLKQHEPIGCRDWTTVFMLKTQGIAAFFSGCLTMTIGDNYSSKQSNESIESPLTAYVEAQGDNASSAQDDQFIQVGEYVKSISIEDGIQKANDLLINYLDYTQIYTSRLHCYLPCTSMGLKVSFKPKNSADQRYSGLFPLSEDQFHEIRSKLRRNLNAALSFVVNDAPSRSEFYLKWEEIWAEELSHADQLYLDSKNTSLIPSGINIKESLAILQKTSITSHSENSIEQIDTIKIAFGFDQNLINQFEITLSSIISNTASRIYCYVLGRNLPSRWISDIIRKYHNVLFKFYDMTSIDYGNKCKTLKHITVSTMDRLFLPELVNDQKIIYLDTDLIVRHDIALLWDTDVSGHFMAGVSSRFDGWKDVMTIVLRASRLCTPFEANNLRMYTYANFPGALGKNFNAGVLLLNLDRLRSAQMLDKSLTLIMNYFLNDQDILALFSNGDVLELDRSFNNIPNQSFHPDPFIVHWAGPRKPWKDDIIVPYADEYQKYESLS